MYRRAVMELYSPYMVLVGVVPELGLLHRPALLDPEEELLLFLLGGYGIKSGVSKRMENLKWRPHWRLLQSGYHLHRGWLSYVWWVYVHTELGRGGGDVLASCWVELYRKNSSL
jgi:hypothetical protein